MDLSTGVGVSRRPRGRLAASLPRLVEALSVFAARSYPLYSG